MPVGRLLNSRRTAHCFKNIDIWIILRDVEVWSRCLEMELSFTREDGEDIIEGVALFKYLGRPLEQSDDDWSEVTGKTRKEHQVWGRLGVILRQ